MQIIHKLQPPFSISACSAPISSAATSLSMLMVGCLELAVDLDPLSRARIGASIGTWRHRRLSARMPSAAVFESLVVMRICDVIFALPPILSAMMLGAFLGPGRLTAIIAIATFMIPVFAPRHAGELPCRPGRRDYVLAAARQHGQYGRRAPSRSVHVLPNISMSQIIVQATIQLGLAMLTEAGLSASSASVMRATGADLGADAGGRADIISALAPWLAILPGLAIALCRASASTCSETALRDLLDPARGQPLSAR
jgi:peptide/nickel transport system permease protein